MRAATATPTPPATIAGRPEKVAAPFCDEDEELGADELSAADDEGPLSDEVGPLDSELDAPAPPAPPDEEEPESDEEAADDDCSDDELRERCEEPPELEAAPAPPAPPLPPLELLPPLLDEPPPFEQSVEPWPTVKGAEAAPAPVLSVT